MNCKSSDEFISWAHQTASSFQLTAHHVYIATNEKNVSILEQISREGFLTVANLTSKLSSLESFIFEAQLMIDALYFFGSYGTSTIDDQIGAERHLQGKSNMLPLGEKASAGKSRAEN